MNWMAVELTTVQDLITFGQWILGACAVVTSGLCVAVVALWKAMHGNSRKYAEIYERKEKELECCRAAHLEDVRGLFEKLHDTVQWAKRMAGR